MKYSIIDRLKGISEKAGDDGSAVVCGYLIGATSWGLISEDDGAELRGDHIIEWADYEVRDDPFFPDVSVESNAVFRGREMDLIEEEDYLDLETTWTEKVSKLTRVNRKEIRVELALRIRGKLQDYAGQWWLTSAFMWTGYLIALRDYEVLTSLDYRYLITFLPRESQSLAASLFPR